MNQTGVALLLREPFQGLFMTKQIIKTKYCRRR